MYSRKFIDFKLWKIALLLHKLGYYFLPEGRQLFTDISNIINKKRYSNVNINSNEIIENIFKKSEEIFNTKPPFDLNIEKSHVKLVREFNIYKRKSQPTTVYIYKVTYNSNNERIFKLIEGSPFYSYSLAHKALGLLPSSNTCNRYIDTDKLYKKEYLISSSKK
jgi:hypothetical protein